MNRVHPLTGAEAPRGQCWFCVVCSKKAKDCSARGKHKLTLETYPNTIKIAKMASWKEEDAIRQQKESQTKRTADSKEKKQAAKNKTKAGVSDAPDSEFSEPEQLKSPAKPVEEVKGGQEESKEAPAQAEVDKQPVDPQKDQDTETDKPSEKRDSDASYAPISMDKTPEQPNQEKNADSVEKQ